VIYQFAVVWSSTNDDIHSEIQNYFILDTAGWGFPLVEDQTKAFKKVKCFLNLKAEYLPLQKR
jgi:hypothetical protein